MTEHEVLEAVRDSIILGGIAVLVILAYALWFIIDTLFEMKREQKKREQKKLERLRKGLNGTRSDK